MRSTYNEPNKTRSSRINTEYITDDGTVEESQNNKIINTALSVVGSKITPNLETKLYLLATIPSKESDSPITAINTIKVKGLKSSEVKLKNRYKDKKNLDSVIKLGSKKHQQISKKPFNFMCRHKMLITNFIKIIFIVA